MDINSLDTLEKISLIGLLFIIIGALVKVVLSLYKRNNELIDNQIEDNTRNIAVIGGMKNTIENVTNEIKNVKEDIKEIKNKLDK